MAGEAETESGSGGLAWASAAVNVSNIFMRAARMLGRSVPPGIVRSGAHLGNAATVAAVAYEVYTEDGLKHKTKRAAAGLAVSGVNIGLGTAAATAGETAALTGVAGATGAGVMAAATPVVLSVAATVATAKVADLSIKNHRAYEALDRDVARDAAAQKIRRTADGDNRKPSILDYKHMGAMGGVTARLRDDALHVSIPVERYAGSGRIKNLTAIDMTDPQNLGEYERALHEEIEHQQAIMSANDSVLPRWMRHGDSVEQYNFADGELQNLLGAKDELALFRQEVQRYDERVANVAGGDTTPALDRHDSAPGSKGKAAHGFNNAVAGVSGTQASSHSPEQTASAPTRPSHPVTPG
jgi:hypothetical protein